MEEDWQTAYTNDFKEQVQDVDQQVFVEAGHPPALVFVYEAKPEYEGACYHLFNFASYYPKLTLPSVGEKKRPIVVPAYIIHAPFVLRFLDGIQNGSTISGIGDHAIREHWFVLAAGLVRLRVLAEKKFFPKITLRTKEDMVQYRLLFSAKGNEFEGLQIIEKEHRRVMTELVNEPYNIDLFWTLELVTRAMEFGETIEESLGYISKK